MLKGVRFKYADRYNGICYTVPMTTKELVLNAVKDLPEDAAIEDAMERLLVLAKIERGIVQADAGKTISNEELKERLAKWLR